MLRLTYVLHWLNFVMVDAANITHSKFVMEELKNTCGRFQSCEDFNNSCILLYLYKSLFSESKFGTNLHYVKRANVLRFMILHNIC